MTSPSGLQRATEQQQEATCGAQHPTNPSFIPCMRRASHPPDYHWSTSGCDGGSFAWHGNSAMFMAAHTVTERPAVGGSDTPANQPEEPRCICGEDGKNGLHWAACPVIPSPLLLDQSTLDGA